MNSKIFVVFIFSIFLIPKIAFGAWWNPFSWNWTALFNDSQPVQIEIQKTAPVVEKVTSTSTPQISPVIQEKSVQPKSITIPQPISKPITPIQTQPQVSIPVQTLQIQNVVNDITKKVAKIKWTTTIPAQSKLLLDNGTGKGYESLGGFGTSHWINIEEPIPSTEYIYKIVATTNDGKLSNDYYGSFTAIREFGISLSRAQDGCRIIHIEDTIGKPARDMKVTISGTFGDSVSIRLPEFTTRTDKDGEITDWPHCKNPRTLTFKGEDLDITIDVSSNNTNFFYMSSPYSF